MHIRTWMTAAALSAFMFTPAAGQSLAGLGAINGVVKDASGAVIPGAKVVVANPEKGIRRALETNEAGIFSAPSLTPGPGYEVSVDRAGFAQYSAKQIEVLVGSNVTLNIELGVQAQSQAVTVNESTPLVETTKTGVSQVVEGAQITNLPINGRRVDTFVLLTPGVTNDGTFGLVSFRGIPGGNAFLTDGNDTTQGYYNEGAGRTRISSNISQDAVQEFQVQSSGMTAEFGRAVGGSINTVTRSGTNTTHGTAYWFFRNHSLNARDRYATRNPKESRHQFGGSAGGALKKDQLFYFLNAEWTRRDFPAISTVQNPQLFDASGIFIGTCAAPANATQCQNAVNYFKRFFGEVPRTADQDTYFGKLDWRPSERNSFSASFNLMNWISPNGIQTQATLTGGAAIGNNGDSSVRHRFARLAHTGIISPSLVNEARFGWFKDRLYDSVNSALAPPNGLVGQLTVQGQGNLGVANFLPRVQPTEDRFQFADNLTWLTGAHNIKFGFDFAHTRDTVELLSNGRGSYTYPSFTAFALDLTNLDGGKRWQNYSQTFGDPKITIFVRDWNFFVQDQWRVNAKLTLNYGIRYEYAQFAQPKLFNPDYPQTASINQPKLNFAPRAGMAYTFGSSGKTVLRASYGVFYARMPGALVGNIHQSNGVYQKAITYQSTVADQLAAGPVFPAFLPSTNLNPPTGTVSIGFPNAALRTPYTQQWDIGIEHELTRSTGITISYLGSRGNNFFMNRDLNIGPATGSYSYRILDTAGVEIGSYSTPGYLRANRVDPRYSRVNELGNFGKMWYDGMVVQVRQRATKYLQGTLAYTWSHARDYNAGGGNSNLFIVSDSPRTVANGAFAGEKATSDLDQRHRLVVTGLVEMPGVKSDNGFVKYVVNGWNLSMIGTFSSAFYWTPTIRVNSNFSGSAFTNTLNGFGGSFRVPFLARTSLPVEGVARLDARLSKALRFTERYQLSLNFEAFNVFNNVSNTGIITEGYQATTGVIRQVAGMGRGNASQGFPDGTNARRAQVSARFVF